MNPFDADAFPPVPGEGRPDPMMDRFAEALGVELVRTEVLGDVPGDTTEKGLWADSALDDEGDGDEWVDDEQVPWVLEFALSRNGEFITIEAAPLLAPDGIPEWAWQAFLEGIVHGARGRALMSVAEEIGRLESLFVDEDEVWDEVDTVEERMNRAPVDPRRLPPEEDPLF